jgi:hypothetical protein
MSDVTHYVGFLIGRQLGAPPERTVLVRVVASAAIVAFVSSRIPGGDPWLLVELVGAGLAYLALIVVLGVAHLQDVAAFRRAPASSPIPDAPS